MTVGPSKKYFPAQIFLSPPSQMQQYLHQRINFSTYFTHLTQSGKVKMVDVTNKKSTIRLATASATINLGSHLVSLITTEAGGAKGDVITTAKLAAIQAAKCTSSLIPLCHLIALSNVSVDITLDQESAHIICTVKAHHNTGVEMEALTGATVAALTIYDMCKAVNKKMVITDVKLLSKVKGEEDASSSSSSSS